MWEKTKANLKLAYDVLVAAGKEFGADRVGRMAAAVAYRTMFALAPLFLLAVTVFGFVLGNNDAAREQIMARVAEFAGSQVADALDTFIRTVEVSGETTAILGLALLLWTASSLFIEIQADLNDIFHVPQDRISGVMGFIRKRLLGFAWVVGVGVLLITIWLLNAAWRFVGDELLPAGADRLHFVLGLLAPLVSVIVLPLVLAVFFQSMSAVRVAWRAVWWGAFFTSVAFLAAAYGASLYFAREGDSVTKAAAALFVILLLAFVMSTVFLYGAEVTKVYADYLERGDVMPPSERDEYRPEVLVSEPERSVPLAAIGAFLVGLLVGRRRGD